MSSANGSSLILNGYKLTGDEVARLLGILAPEEARARGKSEADSVDILLAAFRVRTDVSDFLTTDYSSVKSTVGLWMDQSSIPKNPSSPNLYSVEAQRIITLAIEIAEIRGHVFISALHLILAMIIHTPCLAYRILVEMKVDTTVVWDKIVDYLPNPDKVPGFPSSDEALRLEIEYQQRRLKLIKQVEEDAATNLARLTAERDRRQTPIPS